MAMKPKSPLWTFSLRILLIVLTMAAIGLAVIGNRLIEDRKQQRLYERVVTLMEADARGRFTKCVTFGPRKATVSAANITVPTAQAIVDAKWIKVAGVDVQDSPPEVADILLRDFETDAKPEFTYWIFWRKGFYPDRDPDFSRN